ncbi:MAG: SDR family oxidoreductase [Flavobacteriaceae bacterium]|nr:SDR family oxidoreductase [Flavobacteriaceae bacterium]
MKRKTILIIGGSKGIGAAFLQLLQEDHNMINFSRNSPVPHPNVQHYSLDILKDDLPKLPDLDGLVYCPGSIQLKPFKRLELEAFKQDFEINVLGAIRAIQEYIPQLSNALGSVILFSTVATHIGMPFHASVASSKAAIEGLTKSLAGEYAKKIRFNCIAPTITDTTLASKLLRNDKQRQNMANRHPLEKILQAEDVAKLGVYLLSDDAWPITGQVFPIDAGIISIKS